MRRYEDIDREMHRLFATLIALLIRADSEVRYCCLLICRRAVTLSHRSIDARADAMTRLMSEGKSSDN